MSLKIFTDGGSKGNPGPASIGIAMYKDGELLDTYREDIGIATNNQAEYEAVIKALEMIARSLSNWIDVECADFYSDSMLLVHQLNGVYKVKKDHIRQYIVKIRVLESQIGFPIRYHYTPRENNTVADALVNDVFTSQVRAHK